jgi:hypothetical protein
VFLENRIVKCFVAFFLKRIQIRRQDLLDSKKLRKSLHCRYFLHKLHASFDISESEISLEFALVFTVLNHIFLF